MTTSPVRSPLSRRGFLAGAAGLGSTGLLTACVGSGGDSSSGGSSGGGGKVVLQNSIQDAKPKAALVKLARRYSKATVTVNSVATEQFRAQLSTYLTSSNPPDVLSWYAGSVANTYAEQGLLLDLSDLWKGDGVCAPFSTALRALSTDAKGKQIFVPIDYYWWSVFYKKSAFARWGVQVPTTWDGFISLCQTLKGKGVYPLTNGIGPTPWMASGWFDYLDLRVNGATFHRELLAGKHSFDDPKVKDVMDQYARLLPFFHPNQTSWDDQQAVTPLVNDQAAMYLVGSFITGFLSDDQVADLDFFSVPPISTSVPSAEEAPTDGFFASAGSKNVGGAKAFLSYLAAAAQEKQYIADSASANLPTNPGVATSGYSALVQKGAKLLQDTKEITQFFNRDSSDALQTTADTALTKFIADPGSVDQVLADWQAAAKAARAS